MGASLAPAARVGVAVGVAGVTLPVGAGVTLAVSVGVMVLAGAGVTLAVGVNVTVAVSVGVAATRIVPLTVADRPVWPRLSYTIA